MEFLLTIWVYLQFDQHTEGFQFLVQKDWITLPLGSLGVASIDYLIGVDGISMPMVLLTGLVMFIGSISSFEIGQKEKAYLQIDQIKNLHKDENQLNRTTHFYNDEWNILINAFKTQDGLTIPSKISITQGTFSFNFIVEEIINIAGK